MTDRQVLELLIAAAVSAVVAIAGGLVLRIRRPARADGAGEATRAPAFPWIAPPAIGLAYLAGHVLIEGPPRWPPGNSESRLFLLAAGLTLVCMLPVLAGRLGVLIWALLPLAAAAAPAAVLWPRLRAGLSEAEGVWAVAAAAGVLITAWCLIMMERQRWSRAAGVILCGLAAATAATLLASHTLKLAQFSLAITAAAGGLVAVARAGSPRWLTGGGLLLGTSLLGALVLAGGRFADVPPWSGIALAVAAPAGFAAGLIRPRSGVARVLAAAVPAAAGVIIAVVANAGAGGGGEYPY